MADSIIVFTRTLGAAFLTLILASAGALGAGPYSFYVVPQYSASAISEDWEPLLMRLSQDTGVAFELKIAPSIPKFETKFLQAIPDFIYLNPYHMVMANNAHGYLPLIRNTKNLSGILLAKKDGPFKTVQDLDGQTIAFPSPNAFGASLYMRALLTEAVGIQFATRYVKTHPNVYRHVLRNNAGAGGTVSAAFNNEQAQIRAQLNIIYQTPELASHPLAVHPRVPDAIRQKITQALLKLTQDAVGRTLLEHARMARPIRADYERDYFLLVKLQLEKYLVLEDK
ncbi:phosphate/phosphite/phosphonate ABC transporter substrate-binding protein [Reinekea sp.]|uniref:phosphate/phosphite/phosphonate ABC transporter substrate-binding protein n=1 Tax=Reinekea sp. TaxID=1970455 RepID=UPI002A83061A|nr:phosphate/phosphite/phosphonate ABC transporter substrate-binding protein [Reinekea sp.]